MDTQGVVVPAIMNEDVALQRAKERIKMLTLELRCHDDVERQLTGLQRRVNDTRVRAKSTVNELEKRLDLMEELWVEQLDAEERRLLMLFAKKTEAENCRKLGEFAGVSAQATERLAALSEKARVAGKFEGTIAQSLHKIGVDREREQINEIKEKINKVNSEIERQSTAVAAINPHDQDAVYGVCELTENYKSSIQSLANAVEALERVGRLPAITQTQTTGSLPTGEEIVRIKDNLKQFLSKLRHQLANACIIGSPACSPRPHYMSEAPAPTSNLDTSILAADHRSGSQSNTSASASTETTSSTSTASSLQTAVRPCSESGGVSPMVAGSVSNNSIQTGSGSELATTQNATRSSTSTSNMSI